MALFSFGKKEEGKPVSTASPKQVAEKDVAVTEKATAPRKKMQSVAASRIASILVRPRVTEKATFAIESGVYVFDVAPAATKAEVQQAIQHYYKVTPRKINMVTVPRKLIQSRFRGLRGISSGGKKAYVYLKEGDSIEVV